MNEDDEEDMREAISFFKTAKLPMAIRLSPHEIILDTEKFIDSHISTLRHNWKNLKLRQPPFERFMKAYELIKTKKYEELDITASIKPVAEPIRQEKPKPQPKKSTARRKK